MPRTSRQLQGVGHQVHGEPNGSQGGSDQTTDRRSRCSGPLPATGMV
jgi:hypothetical protein